jgi:hypothetical protein
MKLMSRQLFIQILFVAMTLLLVVVQGQQNGEKKMQLMSNGETPSEYVRNKINSHDVSTILF